MEQPLSTVFSDDRIVPGAVVVAPARCCIGLVPPVAE
jgi:hypothetical protein